jgi:hypothetical protein
MLTAPTKASIAPEPACRRFSAEALNALAFGADPTPSGVRKSFPSRHIDSRGGPVAREHRMSSDGLHRLIPDGGITADTPVAEPESHAATWPRRGAAKTSRHLLAGDTP